MKPWWTVWDKNNKISTSNYNWLYKHTDHHQHGFRQCCEISFFRFTNFRWRNVFNETTRPPKPCWGLPAEECASGSGRATGPAPPCPGPVLLSTSPGHNGSVAWYQIRFCEHIDKIFHSDIYKMIQLVTRWVTISILKQMWLKQIKSIYLL